MGDRELKTSPHSCRHRRLFPPAVSRDRWRLGLSAGQKVGLARNSHEPSMLDRVAGSFRLMLPAQPVDATPSNQLIRQYFPWRTDLFGCTRSKPSQGSVPADLT